MAWHADLTHEMTGPRAEVIVADGMAFLGSYAGHVRAWSVDTGEEIWRFLGEAPVWHSVGYADDSIIVAWMDGNLRALNAPDGRIRWTKRRPAGYATAPTVSEGWVFIGDRSGHFAAHSHRHGGQEMWSIDVGAPILTTASMSRRGDRVVFAAEDMRVRCCEANSGKLVWTSKKLPGLSFRDYAPTVVDDLVLITTMPVKDFHTVLGEQEAWLLEKAGFVREPGRDARFIAGSGEKWRREQDEARRYFEAHPAERCLHALRLRDGTIPWTTPVFYTGGCHNPLTPPAVDRQSGAVYVWTRSAYSVWDGGGEVRPLATPAKLDLNDGSLTPIAHGYASKDPNRPPGAPDCPWGAFAYIGDEAQALSCAPGRLFSCHQGFLGMLRLDDGTIHNLFGKRDTYAGFDGPGTWGWEKDGGPEKAAEAGARYASLNEWHGPARSIVSVAGGRVFFHSGGHVVCLTAEK